jgi:type IV secretory pathway VirB4 component
MRRLVKWLGGRTNVDLSNDYIVFDISEVGKDLLPVVEMIVTDLCRDECMADRIRKKVVIIDELWSIIGAGSNSDAAEFILELFKTIRGLGGSCIGATQDLYDFFALENGKYGKGIINNSRIKVILPLEEEEAVRVKDVLGLSDEETMQVIRNKSGEGLLCAGHNRISVAFQSTRLEYDNITTRRADLEAQLKNRQSDVK